MSLSKKRKVDSECRVFQEKWPLSYFFTKMNDKPVCLICLQQIAVLKEYNLRRHNASLHADKYEKFQGLQRKKKLDELLQCLKNHQSVFTHGRDISDSAVRASYLIAYEIAVSSKPFSEGEFIKTCMPKEAEVVFPEKRQAFANISLIRNTIVDRFSDLSANLNSQLKNEIKRLTAFSVAIDESTDITDVAQLAIFIRVVENTFIVSEEFVEMVPMSSTTKTADIFISLVGALDRVGVDWSHAVSLATDGAPSMIGRKAGVVAMFREKVMQNQNLIFGLFTVFYIRKLCAASH